MPEMDGLQATAAIRDKEKSTGRHIPIVAMTAHAMKGDEERCLAAGMDAYLAKPIHSRELLKVIENLAGIRAKAEDALLSPSTPKENLLDMKSILALFEGDTELIREAVALFLEDLPKQMAAIGEAVERSDAVRINRTAHSLKGSLSNFAAPAAFHAAQKLEDIGGKGVLDQAGAALRILEEQVLLLQSAMAGLEKECV